MRFLHPHELSIKLGLSTRSKNKKSMLLYENYSQSLRNFFQWQACSDKIKIDFRQLRFSKCLRSVNVKWQYISQTSEETKITIN